jgi:endonuclease I
LKPFVLVVASAILASSLSACATLPGLQPTAQGTAGTAFTVRQAPADYYRSAEGQQGQVLLNTLAAIVSRHKELGYDRARDVMFAEVDDLDDNDIVECDYTDRALHNVNDRRTAYRNGAGFNAEHTWPQSKGAVGVAKSDLHHLFPTDCAANSRRSSFPFGEVVKVEWTEGGSKFGTDARGVTVFEPRDDQKGNTARAILYFYTVYGRQADLVNFRQEEETLKKWHVQDPVTAEDRARNEAVYRHQGNRNPFVDRPEFVQAVGIFHASSNMPSFNVW